MTNKKLLSLLLISILSTLFCQAQTDSLYMHLDTSYFSSSTLIKDSCWWVTHTDTVKVDFVIIVDENNFVKKQKADYIIRKFDVKECTGINWYTPNRNEVFLLKNKPIEVLLYKPKGRDMLIGNIR